MKSVAAIIATAKAYTHFSPPGYCLVFVHTVFGTGPHFGSARAAWLGAQKKHYVSSGSQVPAGVPVFWLGGSHGYGHIAVSLGGGLCRSTDWPRSGQVGTARIDDISRVWGQRLQGWTEDLNTKPIYNGNRITPAQPVLSAAAVAAATKGKASFNQGTRLKAAVAAEVGRGPMNLASSVLGSGFQTQYKLVQKKFLGGHAAPKDIDGIPGISSLQWLGGRHGFTARP